MAAPDTAFEARRDEGKGNPRPITRGNAGALVRRTTATQTSDVWRGPYAPSRSATVCATVSPCHAPHAGACASPALPPLCWIRAAPCVGVVSGWCTARQRCRPVWWTARQRCSDGWFLLC